MKKYFLASTLLMAVAPYAIADDFQAGNLVISNPLIRETPANAPVSGGYMTISNNGSEPDRLIGGSALFAKSVEIHEMEMVGDVMKMREIAGLTIEPGETVTLMPGGYHIMFIGLDQRLKAGDAFKAKLDFERAGRIEVEFDVETLDQIRKSMGAMPAHGQSGDMKNAK